LYFERKFDYFLWLWTDLLTQPCTNFRNKIMGSDKWIPFLAGNSLNSLPIWIWMAAVWMAYSRKEQILEIAYSGAWCVCIWRIRYEDTTKDKIYDTKCNIVFFAVYSTHHRYECSHTAFMYFVMEKLNFENDCLWCWLKANGKSVFIDVYPGNLHVRLLCLFKNFFFSNILCTMKRYVGTR
jgi:hypothetical protein